LLSAFSIVLYLFDFACQKRNSSMEKLQRAQFRDSLMEGAGGEGRLKVVKNP